MSLEECTQHSVALLTLHYHDTVSRGPGVIKSHCPLLLLPGSFTKQLNARLSVGIAGKNVSDIEV